MKTITRIGSVIKTQDFKGKKKEKHILSLVKRNSGSGYIRKGNFSTEIIWDNKSYVFPSDGKHKSYTKGMFLFGMVRKDANSFIKSGKSIKIPKKYPVNQYNNNFNNFIDKITGTDLNHAYWRIAYNLGVISKRTYFSGLDDEFKTVRLAALSTLGKGKDYFVIKNGIITQDIVRIGYNESMDALYKAIRYSCYKYMQCVKRKLKNDFLCYRTDCIYYIDTPDNRAIVRDFFKEKNMGMKQLYRIKKTLHEQSL